MKQCNTCHQFKELSDFYSCEVRGKQYFRHICKVCKNIQQKESPSYQRRKAFYASAKAEKERLIVECDKDLEKVLLHEQDCDVNIMRELNGY